MTLPIIRDLLNDYFDEDELQTLSFDLGVAYKNLAGNKHITKAQSLVEHCLTHKQLPQLLARCRELRPTVTWPDLELADNSEPLQAVYEQTIALLSTPRYQLDHRFVRLTLLLDQGQKRRGHATSQTQTMANTTA